jgi:hypothetical protein
LLRRLERLTLSNSAGAQSSRWSGLSATFAAALICLRARLDTAPQFCGLQIFNRSPFQSAAWHSKRRAHIESHSAPTPPRARHGPTGGVGSRCKRSRTAFASRSRCWEYRSVAARTSLRNNLIVSSARIAFRLARPVPPSVGLGAHKPVPGTGRSRSIAERRGRDSARARHKGRISDLGLGVLRRNEPRIPRVATNIPLCAAHGSRPTTQVKHRDEHLLARNDRHIRILVDIEVLVLGRDLVDPGSDVAIERATRLNRSDIQPIDVDIGGVEALRGRTRSGLGLRAAL